MPGVLLCFTLGTILPSAAARAQSAPTQDAESGLKMFDIPAGALEPALDRFARAAGIDLSYDPAAVSAATTKGLQGNFSTAAGLTALLSGTGIAATATPSGGYALQMIADDTASTIAKDTVPLPAVTVRGRAEDTDFQARGSSVGSKTTTDPHDIAQATTSVTQALMQSEGVTSFQQALRNVPGITIGGAEGTQIGDNINLRGFMAQTDIYRDGFRDSGQYYRDTFDLESIDVLYGPSSLLFGRGSTGGVVNQVSKKANLTPSAQVSTTIGTDQQYRTTLDLNQPLSATSAIRLNAFGQDMGSTREVMTNQDYGFAPSARFGIGTPTEITLSALIQHNDDQPDFGVPPLNGHPAPVSAGAFFGLINDRTIQDVQIFNATIRHKINDDLTIQNQTQWANYQDNILATGARSVLTGPLATSPALANGNFTNLPLSQLFVTLMSHDAVIGDHTLFNDTDIFYKFNTGFIKHDFDAGIELGRETVSDQATIRNNLPIFSLLDPAEISQPADVTTTNGNLSRASANSFAAYINDTLSLGPHWKFVGGVRWDSFRPELSNTTSAPAFAAQTNDFTSVRAGLIYQPGEAQSYYVSYGTSFDPSLEQLMAQNGTQNLAPETSKSYEVGGKWDLLQGNLSLTAAAFQVDQNNSRTEVAPAEFTLDGNIRVRGAQGGIIGHITPRWQVYGGYTYLDARILAADDGTTGKVPTNTPRHAFTLWSTYEITPAWEIGGGPTYVGARFATNNNLVEVPGYTRWDAEAAYRQKKYVIRLNLMNLTNKLYYTDLLNSDGGRTVPGFGRELLATFTYQFY